MDFSAALAALKDGQRVTRYSWFPEAFVALQKGYPAGVAINENTASATGIEPGTVCVFAPYLVWRNALGVFAPWEATSADLLAEDWALYE